MSQVQVLPGSTLIFNMLFFNLMACSRVMSLIKNETKIEHRGTKMNEQKVTLSTASCLKFWIIGWGVSMVGMLFMYTIANA